MSWSQFRTRWGVVYVVRTFSPKQARTTRLLDGTPAEMAAALVGELTRAKVLGQGGA